MITQHVIIVCIRKKKLQKTLIPKSKVELPTKPNPIQVEPTLNIKARIEINILYVFVISSTSSIHFFTSTNFYLSFMSGNKVN